MNNYWRILGIEETRDQEQIKAAYRGKLISVNPEDDPAGFKRLREAYEQAVHFAASEVMTVEIEEDQSEPGQWRKKLEQVYSHISKRRSAAIWKELLAEDVCQALDTWNDVRDILLDFLMDHFRLPYEVWQLLDKNFHFVEDEKELREKYHPNFIDYVINSCKQPSLFNYALFEGPDEADYDLYIRLYYDLKSKIDEGGEFPHEIETEILELGIYYPYLEVEKARSMLQQDLPESAQEIIAPLVEKYPFNDYIKYYQAQIYWGLGEYEQAKNCYDQLLLENPDHFSARLGIALYLEQTAQFKLAKEAFLQLLEIDPMNQTAHQGMQRVNECLIVNYQQELAENAADQNITLELCWCLFQNEQFDEAILLLDQMNPSKESEFDYHNIKGRAYLRKSNYEQALPHISFWLERLRQITDDDNEEMRKRRRRLGYAYYAKAECILNGYQNPDQNKQKEILDLFDQAIAEEISYEARLSYYNGKAQTLLLWREYQRAADVCDYLISLSKGYFPAYIIRQEAYYHLRYYQNVIDDYYRAVEIYADYLPPYLFAIKTFWEVNEFEAGLNVVLKAEEQNLVSDEMLLYKARFLRNQAADEQNSEKALAICQELIARMSEGSLDSTDQAEVYAERAKCLMDLRQFDQAMADIDRASEINKEEQNYYYIKGNIYFRTGRYQQALELYQQLDQQMPGNPVIINRIAETYVRLDQKEMAISGFLKVLETDDQHPTANHSLMELYQRCWEDTEKREYYELSKQHASRQIEITPEAYYYIERGLIYTDGKEYELAIKDFEQSLLDQTHDVYAYSNLGVVYCHMREYEKGRELLLKAVEAMTGAITTLPYRTLGNCYCALGEYEKALKCYQENVKLFPQTASVYRDLGHYYRDQSEYDSALKTYETGMNQEFANRSQFLRYQAKIYRKMGKDKAAQKVYQNLIRENGNDLEAREALADYLYYTKRKYALAVREYLELLKRVSKDDIQGKYGSCCSDLGQCYFYMGKKDEAKTYLKRALEFYQRGTGSLSDYFSCGGYPARLYQIILIYYYLGDLKSAKDLYQRMKTADPCDYCDYQECYELCLIEGLFAHSEGDLETAVRKFEKACEISGSEQECQFLLEHVTKKKWRFRLW